MTAQPSSAPPRDPAESGDDAPRESESKYRLLVDSIDEGFCVIEMLLDPVGQRLAAEHPDVLVVWMSGYPRDSAFGEGEPAGTLSFLQKPITAEVLVRTVQDVLARAP